jgi:hypothetical protein
VGEVAHPLEQTSGNISYFNLVVGLNFELAMSVSTERLHKKDHAEFIWSTF